MATLVKSRMGFDSSWWLQNNTPIPQWLEDLPYKRAMIGSIPSRSTRYKRDSSAIGRDKKLKISKGVGSNPSCPKNRRFKNMICENCEKEYLIIYGSGRFCCEKCARSFSTKNKRLEINKAVSEKLKGKKFDLKNNTNKRYTLKRKIKKLL